LTNNRFPVMGVDASAGGVEALQVEWVEQQEPR
jgi:hypothetical protein